jgi:hypothetical protein
MSTLHHIDGRLALDDSGSAAFDDRPVPDIDALHRLLTEATVGTPIASASSASRSGVRCR